MRSIGREGRALKHGDIDYIVIYKATSYGMEPTATCRSGVAVAGVCNVYVGADLDRPMSQL